MNNQTTIKNKELLGREVCLSGNASFQPAGEFLNKEVGMTKKEKGIIKIVKFLGKLSYKEFITVKKMATKLAKGNQ